MMNLSWILIMRLVDDATHLDKLDKVSRLNRDTAISPRCELNVNDNPAGAFFLMTYVKLTYHVMGSLCTIKQLDLKISKPSAISDLIRPVEGALETWEATALHQVGQHHHHSHLILPNHTPKSWTCLLARALGCNIFS